LLPFFDILKINTNFVNNPFTIIKLTLTISSQLLGVVRVLMESVGVGQVSGAVSINDVSQTYIICTCFEKNIIYTNQRSYTKQAKKHIRMGIV